MISHYQEIAKKIEQNIANQTYGDMLPPLRELSKQFNVSLSTIQKALSVLSKRSLIVADSTRGVRIVYRPKSKIIGVFCNFRKGSSSDVVVQSLRRAIEKDGYEAIFVDIPEKVCNEPGGAFWRYGWADGYVSLYGTSDTKIDLCLQNFDLPVVTANHAYRNGPLHCVDFDHRRLVRELAEGLYKRGYRRIALSFTICSKLISEEVNAEFSAFLSNHNLSCRPEWLTGASESDIEIPREARIARQFEEMLNQEAECPEAIICFHHGLKFAVALAAQYGLIPGSDIVLAGTGRGDTPQPGVLPVEFSYHALANGLWEQLKKHLANPGKPETLWIPPPPIDWRNIPEK